MRMKRTGTKTIILLTFFMVLLVLSACQNEERIDEVEATLEATAQPAEEEPTLEPTIVPPTPEPTSVPPTSEPTPEPVSEEEGGTSSFTSADDSIRFSYPVDWSVMDTGPGRVILANSDEALAVSGEGVLRSGDMRINITLVPANMLADYGLHMGNNAEEALQFIFDSGLFAPKLEDTQVGEIQGLELENTTNAAQMSIATSDQEGVLITVTHSDQVVVFVSVVAPTGEYSNFEGPVRQLVDSINISVTADELIALIASSVQE